MLALSFRWRWPALPLLALAATASSGQTTQIVCPVTADVSLLSTQPDQVNANAGDAPANAVQSNRAYLALKFDTAPLEGMLIRKATLRLRRVETLLVRVGVSTIASDWTEGGSQQLEPVAGAACYQYAGYARDPRQARWWAPPGSDLADVVFGNGGSRWVPRVARFDKDSLWYEIDVPPDFVQAIAQGVQPGGLCISDDFGRHETTPTVASRESAHAPELVVEAERVVPEPSRPPTDLANRRDALGLDWIEFRAPHALGFEVYLADRPLSDEAQLDAARKLPTWAMPSPGADALSTMITLSRGREHTHAAVRVVEPGKSWSPLVSLPLSEPIPANPAFTAPTLPRHDLPTTFERSFTMDDGPALSEDGKWIRNAAKTWWPPNEGPIPLQAGRNEFVAFQVALAGGPGAYRVTLTDWQSPGVADPAPRTRLFRQHYAQIPFGREKYAPDGAVPLESGDLLELDLLTPAATSQPTSQPERRRVVQAVWVEMYVPHKAARGVWRARLIATRDGRADLDVPVELEVTDPALPDRLNFAVSLETRKGPARALDIPPDDARAWALLDACHRLAHEHRATLAVMPYGQNGEVSPGYAPDITSAGAPRVDWKAWDARFARYLDGSAFRDLPREAVPLHHFYLPFHENWPMPFRPRRAPADAPLAEKYHYLPTWTDLSGGRRPGPRRDSYLPWPIQNAFDGDYAEGNAAVMREFAAHARQRGWDRTSLHVFLNNRFARRAQSSWWLLSGPEVPDDYLALRFWLGMYSDALGESREPMRLRVNDPDPRFQRDYLDGLCDVTVLDHAVFQKSNLVLTHPTRFGEVWHRTGAIRAEAGWTSAYEAGWTARLAGARGLVVTESLGSDEAWERTKLDALLYPGSPAGHDGPLPSLRLKALLRVQQDLEWLETWLEHVRADGSPTGYALAVVGQELARRTRARSPVWPPLLPVIDLPNQLDTVVFEEIRRGLRQAVAER